MFRLELCRLCASVEPEMPPPITMQSYNSFDVANKLDGEEDEPMDLLEGIDARDVLDGFTEVNALTVLIISSAEMMAAARNSNLAIFVSVFDSRLTPPQFTGRHTLARANLLCERPTNTNTQQQQSTRERKICST